MTGFDLPFLPGELPWKDAVALTVFLLLWLGYEPAVRRISKGRGAINRDMDVIRVGWMRELLRRKDSRLLDANLMGHALNSASFFASANLILIAAVAGVLFGGESTWRGVRSVDVLAPAPTWLFQLKMGLVLLTLARGLLDFIWAIRQMNFWLAAVGAAPEEGEPGLLDRWADALGTIISPALTNFSAGVRGYYFALAAASWLIGPLAFGVASVTAALLLLWRQSQSKAAYGVRLVRDLVHEDARGLS
jgi:uncharacterized membrane protein